MKGSKPKVLRRIQSSRAFLFHDSTDFERHYRYARRFGSMLMGQLPATDAARIEEANLKLSKTLNSISKRQQKELDELLGRLKEKYRVGISLHKINPEYLPFTMTLGDEAVSVGLENWGSGTQNRTWILMTLFHARRISQAATSAAKITPIIVIEEPESFLHPSAQAEFGKIIQDLADEFRVQVIAATHSPYMLSQHRPESNILLSRRLEKNRLRETTREDTTGERWMEPFALALGLDNEQFKPWRDALFSNKDSILMVEGETDREYMQLLQGTEHGDKRLKFTGEIFAYSGKDTLKQRVLLQFIKNRYKKCFVTYDLDSESEIGPLLESLNLQRNRHFSPIGLDNPGKRCIEGLLPERVHAAVYSANPGLVQQATQGNKNERQNATNQLKRLYLEQFKQIAVPGEEFYGKFYTLGRTIEKALC